MNAFIHHYFVHIIAAVTILSRVADVATTYLVTPRLKLEANAIARRLGWKYALATILIGFIPYYSVPMGIIVLTASLLVAASNASKIMMARVLGEDELAALNRRVLAATPLWPGLFYILLPAFLVGLLGAVMLLFYPTPDTWGYYFAYGVLVYAFVIAVWGPLRFLRAKARLGQMGG